jgi:hypothetical protein
MVAKMTAVHMQNPTVAAPVNEACGHLESLPARSRYRAVLGRLVGSRPVRWAFILGVVVLAGSAIARDWAQIACGARPSRGDGAGWAWLHDGW